MHLKSKTQAYKYKHKLGAIVVLVELVTAVANSLRRSKEAEEALAGKLDELDNGANAAD